MNNEQPQRVQINMVYDEAVKFTKVFSRLPTNEEKQLVLRKVSEIVANDRIRIGEFDESDFDYLVNEYMKQHQSQYNTCSYVTYFSSLGIKVFVTHDFTIGNTEVDLKHHIGLATIRFIIRDNDEVEMLEDDDHFIEII